MSRPLRKRFGQHLLCNPATINNIVNVINPKANENLVEIGPGRGAITIPILKSVGRLHAIEIDRDIANEVRSQCQNLGELILHQDDVLNFNFNALGNEDSLIRLFGNLPYNISTPLLFHLLKFSHVISDMHFMLQKEVVERITAVANSSAYSRLSVMIQCSYKVESLFDISPEEFKPPPKVNSSFLRLIPDDTYASQIKDMDTFAKLIECAFQQRRKTIRNSLARQTSEEQLKKASIDPSQRPQELTIQQYIRLSNELSGGINSTATN